MIDQEIKIAPVNLETKSVPTEKTATSQPNFIQTFSTLLIDQLNTQDVNVLLQTQRQIIQKLDATNKSLVEENHNSLQTFGTFAMKDFQSHITTLNSMKQDLDFIFKRIRAIKKKLETKYPKDFLSATSLIRSNKNHQDSDDEYSEQPQSKKENEESSINADLIVQEEAATSDSTN